MLKNLLDLFYSVFLLLFYLKHVYTFLFLHLVFLILIMRSKFCELKCIVSIHMKDINLIDLLLRNHGRT